MGEQISRLSARLKQQLRTPHALRAPTPRRDMVSPPYHPKSTPICIGSLPPELLGQVFCHLARILHDEWCRYYAGNLGHKHHLPIPYRSWMQINLVCRDWHTVMHNTPRIWSFIIPTDAYIVPKYLRRSFPALLSVSAFHPVVVQAGRRGPGAGEPTIKLQAAFGEVLKVLPRLHTLKLHLQSPWAAHPLLLGTLDAPSLRCLCITLDSYNCIMPCRKWKMPKLESLEVCARLTTSVSSLFRSTLRHLTLRSLRLPSTHISQASGGFSNMRENLDILHSISSLPHLRSLTLDLAAFGGDFPVSVMLPAALTDLSIVGHTMHCADISIAYSLLDGNSLYVDGTKNFHVRSERYKHLVKTRDVADALLNACSPSTSVVDQCDLHTLSLAVHGGSHTLQLRGWACPHSLSFTIANDSPAQVSLMLPCRESSVHLDRLISLVNFSHVQVLKLGPMNILGGVGYVSSIGSWIRLLHTFQEVHTLVAYDLNIWLMLTLLLAQQQSIDVHFPKLTTLVLVSTKFTPSADVSSASIYLGSGHSQHHQHQVVAHISDLQGRPSDLSQILIFRRESGHPVERLVIREAANLRRTEVHRLRDAVEIVDWDGLESDYTIPNTPTDSLSIGTRHYEL